ncbi:TnsA endonuclease N-terminal domain-containing protein [Oceanisphaera pacifica]|uniref:Tn7 transposase TnsA N-terminal domain-containing protein n=1 Tax=Oceanisphaera pacifica TaxID=2818389 RepID=A0ABS3NGD5_9GAMM|nr:TnsA endonuclease N-terminal domain-containing protein [Oceanisphaera pacifica]MBO1519392.1 Tn7 transposase TnsA N-terminal domain-containing protein [Oceanisphaera pacifica]
MYRRRLKHSPVKNLFRFASGKTQSVLTVESALEFDTCFHLEYSPEITSFEAQPEGFYYSFEGKRCPYTPDFKVHHQKDGEQFIEVKPLSKVLKEDFRTRFQAKQYAARDAGITLLLVTERQIRVYPILNNLKLLHRYSGFQSITEVHLRILEFVERHGMTSLLNLARSTGIKEGELLSTTLSLIATNRLATNLLEQSFCLDSEVWEAI